MVYGFYSCCLVVNPQSLELITMTDRIRQIDQESKGFIYMVSSASITGAKSGISDAQIAYFNRIKAMRLNTPTLIGFGISDNDTFSKACEYATGAIIGSAFVKLLGNSKDKEKSIKEYIAQVKGIN